MTAATLKKKKKTQLLTAHAQTESCTCCHRAVLGDTSEIVTLVIVEAR